MITSAFTCTGSYAILIMLGIKRVENRSVMPVPGKGRCAISCSKSFTKEEYGEFVRWASRALSAEEFEAIPAWKEVKGWPGKIVGACNYSSRSRNDLVLNDGAGQNGKITWDEGYDCWWDLSDVVGFEQPIPCRGNVGMWRMPPAMATFPLEDYEHRKFIGVFDTPTSGWGVPDNPTRTIWVIKGSPKNDPGLLILVK